MRCRASTPVSYTHLDVYKRQGYTFESPSIDLGVLMVDGTPVPDTRIRISLSMLNRHGLVAGATGTGKTRTLQLLAEQISAAGVSVRCV